MDDILSVIRGIADGFTTFLEFVINFFADLAEVSLQVKDSVVSATQLLTAIVPAPALVSIVACLTVAVLYKISGRD